MFKVGIAYRVHNEQQLRQAVEKAKQQGITVNDDFIKEALNSGYLPELCIYKEAGWSFLTYCSVAYFKHHAIPIVPFIQFKDYYNKL